MNIGHAYQAEEAVNSAQLCFDIPWLAVTGCSQNPRDSYAKLQRESITVSNDSNAHLAIHEAGIALNVSVQSTARHP